jgi:methylated-DNA-[protein]-cysteine S-methyltransferase
MPAGRAVQRQFPDIPEGSCREIDALTGRIEAFLNGKNVRFTLDTVRLDLCRPFQRKVLLAEYAIPRGKVSTYGLIAGHLGNPRGARAVGAALAANPFPIVIPCHRAVRSDGGLGGYQGGLKMKRALLEMEGVPFRDEAHVETGHFHY